MKLAITAFAAMFSLMMLTVPTQARADEFGLWHHRPAACSNHYFRRHHRYLCR
jgi:hypothetical protein